MVANSDTGGDFHTYAVNAQGEITDLLQSRPDYDPRQRPWYVKPVQAGATEWSDIYPLFSHAALGITIADPVYDAEGQLIGVVGTDILLSELGGVLRTARIGTSRQAFIMEPAKSFGSSYPSTRRPFSPQDIYSFIGAISEVTTTDSQASASINTNPNPSDLLGMHTQSAQE